MARNEAADIMCEVDAYPPPESFKWSFNNTAETFDMPQSGYRLHSDRASALTYTPVKVSTCTVGGAIFSFVFVLFKPQSIAASTKEPIVVNGMVYQLPLCWCTRVQLVQN